MLRIAHRGASANYPENTLRAFKHALEGHPDMMEFDVRITKDGVVVAMHDKKINRTTDGKGAIKNLTHKELTKVHTPTGETIPTLKEIFDLLAGKAKINIDLKDKKAVKPTVELIEKYVLSHAYSYNDFLLSAFNITILLEVRRYQSGLPIAINFIAFPWLFVPLSKLLGAKVIKPHRRITTKKLVNSAHAQHLLVYVWTVNKPKDIEKMKNIGVDGIITDYPDSF